MEQFEGRVAVITGAGSGVGEGLSRVCAEEGMRVILADIELAQAERVAAELRSGGAEAVAVRVDVSDPESVAELADSAYEAFGAVHLICNNAGVQVFDRMVETSIDDWRWLFDVNVFGPVHGVLSFVPRMREQLASGEIEGAHIVNTGSISGCAPFPPVRVLPAGTYIASKYAVVGFSEALRDELADDGIGVTVLCPGSVKSRIFDAGRNRPGGAGSGGPPVLEQWPGREPEDIARLVLDGVRADRLYVFTDPRMRVHIERRFERMIEDYGALG